MSDTGHDPHTAIEKSHGGLPTRRGDAVIPPEPQPFTRSASPATKAGDAGFGPYQVDHPGHPSHPTNTSPPDHPGRRDKGSTP